MSVLAPIIAWASVLIMRRRSSEEDFVPRWVGGSEEEPVLKRFQNGSVPNISYADFWRVFHALNSSPRRALDTYLEALETTPSRYRVPFLAIQ